MSRMTIRKTLEVNYNLDYLVVVPQKDILLLEAFEYTFENVLLFNNTVDDVEFLVHFLRKNVVGQIIFVDYYLEYSEVINTLIDEHKIKFIFTGSFGELSDEEKLYEYNQVCDKYDCGAIDEIGFLDEGLYRCVCKKRRHVKHVLLDMPRCGERANCDNSIGLLNSDGSNYDSFYNELSSMVFLQKYRAKVLAPTKTTVEFARDFRIELDVVNDRDKLEGGGVCNLDVNFAGGLALKFMRSMDLGVPCVVGNNGFLADEYPVMNENLVVKSDDDINEIAEKVKSAINNKEEILKEYKRFRMDYSEKAKKLACEFLGCDNVTRGEAEYEKILTVVVPVYNTEEYLSNCLDSIIEAKVPEMEILVIDDGSTDGSERVMKEYVGRYPDLIRCIRQKNRGLGNVRNVGLKEARGKYIASVDSDDTIESGFFKEALPYLREDVDVVIYDWMSVAEKESFETVSLDYVFDKRKELEGLLYTTIMPSTCNKILKKSLFVDNGIKYLEQKYEDLSANPLALLKAETVKYIHEPYYNYYLRNNSLMRSRINPREMVDALVYLDKRLSAQNEAINMDEFKYYTYSWRIEEYIINPLYDLKGKELDEAVKYIYKNAYEMICGVLESKYYKKMLRGLKSKELRDFVDERNEAFMKKKLTKLLSEVREPQKLTAGIVYYGD